MKAALTTLWSIITILFICKFLLCFPELLQNPPFAQYDVLTRLLAILLIVMTIGALVRLSAMALAVFINYFDVQ